jgi:hypothetical protein
MATGDKWQEDYLREFKRLEEERLNEAEKHRKEQIKLAGKIIKF